MELSKIFNEMEIFIKLVNTKRNDIMLIVDQLSREVDSIISQLKVLSSINQCVIPAHVLIDFPDVKKRVTVNLVDTINETIYIIDKLGTKLYDVVKDLRKSHEKITRLISEVNWIELKTFYSGCIQIAEWIEGCWKSLNFLYVNVSNGIKFLSCDHTHSAIHLKRVHDIKSFDKAILYAAPDILHLLTMLKYDVTSRSQNVASIG